MIQSNILMWDDKCQLKTCEEIFRSYLDGNADPLLMSRIGEIKARDVNPRHFIAIKSEAFGRFAVDETDMIYCATVGGFVPANELSIKSTMQVSLPPLQWPQRNLAKAESDRALEILAELRLEYIDNDSVCEWPFTLSFELLQCMRNFARFSEAVSKKIWFAFVQTFAVADARSRKAENVMRFSNKRFLKSAHEMCRIVQLVGFRLGYVTRYAFFNGTHCLDIARHSLTSIDKDSRQVVSGVTSIDLYRPKRRSTCYLIESDFLFTTAGTLQYPI